MDEIRIDLTTELCFIPGIFPGAQPVSLDWSNVHTLLQDKHLVAEKTDGERKLFYSCNNESYLIDRQFNGIKTDILATKERTILDGELVIDTVPGNRKVERFLVFDVIVCNGSTVKHLPLLTRLSLFLKNVLEPARVANACQEVYVKEFFKIKDIDTVMNLKLQHPSDGLVFTPKEDAYYGGRCENLFKYKSTTTVDFAAWKVDFSIELYCGVKGEDSMWIGYADEGDKYFSHFYHSISDKTIVECDWENTRQRWRIVKKRNDKSKANDIKIVNWNIRTIVNGLCPEQLSQYIKSNLIE